MEPALIEVGTGRGEQPDSFGAGAEAAAAALAGIAAHAPSCALVYASSRYDPKEALAGVHSVLGDTPTIGATTAGEIADGSAEGSIAVILLASPFVRLHCGVGRGVSRGWRSAVDEMLAAPPLQPFFNGGTPHGQTPTGEGKSLFAILYFPGNTRAHISMGFEILEHIKARSFGRIPIFGGGAADDWKMQGNAVLMGREAHADGVLLAVFETELQFGIALTHGFRDSPRRATVTASEGHELVSLDGAPAAEVLSRMLGSSWEALQSQHVTLTTGRTIGTVDTMGNFSINVAAYFTPRGGVMMTQPLPVGSAVFAMEAEAESMLRAGPEAISKAIGRGGISDPALTVVHLCALRPRLLGGSTDEVEALRSALPGVPLAGFHSFGENGPGDDGVCRHHNAAISVLVLGRDFSQAAKVARENQRLHREAKERALSLLETNRSLQAEIAERKRSEQALQQLRGELEQTVAARTGELQRSNEALRHQLGFNTQLVDGLPGIFYVVDATGRLRRWNERLRQVSGYAPEELDGKPALEFFEGSDQALIAGRIAQVFTEGRAEAEADLITKDGRRLPFHFSGQLVSLDGLPCLIGLGLDIADRRNREAREGIRNRIFELLAGDGPLPEILARVVDYVEGMTPELLGSILLLDESGLHLFTAAAPRLPEPFNRAIDGQAIGDGRGSCGTAAHRGERVIVEDIASHPYWEGFRELAASAGLASCWSEPIRDAGGKVLGTFAIYRRQPHKPDEAEIELVAEAAMLASIAIERRRLDAELQLASSVYRASAEAIVVTDSANRILAVNPAFTRITGYAAADVLGRDPKLLSSGHTPPQEYEAMWQALATSGHWQGEIRNRRKDGSEYVEWLTVNTIADEQGAVHRYVGMFSDITEKKRIEELVWRQANYDAQTGLPNRRLFRDRLQQEVGRLRGGERSLALLFIDLDHFKEVNDTLGHAIGDLLLAEAARRIAACVREADTVARLGGDEFTVVLPSPAGTTRIEEVTRDILIALAEPFHLEGQVAYVSASIGITVYPTDAGDIETLLKNADQAMYVAKALGRNCFSYFTEHMQRSAQARMALSNDLRGALRNGQFELHFQPIVELATGRIVKAEALLRWRHPVHGMVPPAQFIPLAEDSGLIHEIGDWAFRETARMALRWYGAGRPIQISVNKSPRQFFSGDCDGAWIAHLESIGLPAQWLAIEITEGLLLEDRPEVADKLLRLRKAGIAVAIDDFGTGYSAMAYLKKFPIDYLKIDRSFVHDMVATSGDQAIVEAIIVMAHKLGLRVIAEGIEEVAQRDLLTAAGCDYGQGYLFARPLPADQFEALRTAAPAN